MDVPFFVPTKCRTVTKISLCRETQWRISQERAGIINTLVDSEQVQVVQDERKGKG